MKTKKEILLLILLGLVSMLKSYSQEGYCGLGAGYGFPAGGIQMIEYNNSNAFTTQTLSFGKGLNFGLYGGYMINKYIGMELDASYLNNTVKINSGSVAYVYPLFNMYQPPLQFTSYMLRLTPSVRFQYGEKRLRPYAILGLIAGLGTRVTVDFTVPGYETNSADVYSGGYSYGIHGALGIRVLLLNNAWAFIEASANYQDFIPGKEIIEPGQSQVNFVSSGYYSSSGNVTTEPLIYLPFSSLGLNAGIQLSLVKTQKAPQKKAGNL